MPMAAGPSVSPGNPKKPARVVNVVMKDGNGTMAFVPNRIEVKKGEQVRFKLRNDGRWTTRWFSPRSR